MVTLFTYVNGETFNKERDFHPTPFWREPLGRKYLFEQNLGMYIIGNITMFIVYKYVHLCTL
jgi:hypothetical protein